MGDSGSLDPGSNKRSFGCLECPGGATKVLFNGGVVLRIEKFSFGAIRIMGNEYNKDVFVTNDSVHQKENSHHITKDDLDMALLHEPDFLIIGLGTNNMVNFPEEMKGVLKENGVELIQKTTEEAIKDFNKLRNKNKVVGIFHLTC